MIYFNWKKSCLGYIVYQNASFFPNIYHIFNCQKLKAKQHEEIDDNFFFGRHYLILSHKGNNSMSVWKKRYERTVEKEGMRKKKVKNGWKYF